MKPRRPATHEHFCTPLLAQLLVTTVSALLPASVWADDAPRSAGKAPQIAGDTLQFAGRRAAEVLAAYEQRGLAFIYSSDVLDTQRRFAV